MDNNQTRIIVAVEGPEESAAAVSYAAGEARRRHLPLRLVHALHPMLARSDDDLIAVTREPVLRRAQEMLDGVAAEARRTWGPETEVATQLVVGHPAPALVDASDGAAVLVLQPGRMGPDRTHVPTYSVTTAVATRSHVPVVAVPADWSERAGGPVVVGVDGAGGSTQLLQAAFEEAEARSATLRVVHAWHYSVYDDVVFAGVHADTHSAALAAAIRDDLASVADKFPEVPVELVVRHGRPADLLTAESRQAALLVVGRHRVAGRVSRHHLGSTLRAVVREARSPVMLADPVDATWAVGDEAR